MIANAQCPQHLHHVDRGSLYGFFDWDTNPGGLHIFLPSCGRPARRRSPRPTINPAGTDSRSGLWGPLQTVYFQNWFCFENLRLLTVAGRPFPISRALCWPNLIRGRDGKIKGVFEFVWAADVFSSVWALRLDFVCGNEDLSRVVCWENVNTSIIWHKRTNIH